MKFTIDTTKSYNEAEREFFNGPRGRFFLSLQLSINICVYEKGILKMHLEQYNSDVRRWWILQQKGGEKWEDKGYMGASFDETVREDEEESGFMRGGARFR